MATRQVGASDPPPGAVALPGSGGTGSSPVTRAPNQIRAPASRTRATRASRTSRALWEEGKSFPDSSSSSRGIPSSASKNARCSARGQERRIFRRVLGEESVT